MPSPKFHDQFVGVPVEVSANWTPSGADPVVGVAVKPADTVGVEPPSDSCMCQ